MTTRVSRLARSGAAVGTIAALFLVFPIAGTGQAPVQPAPVQTPAASPQVPNQPNPAGGQGAPGARGGGRGGGRGPATPPPADDHAGFVAIFDGKTLTNWDGDPRIWRAENGAIVGETTPDKQITDNTFLVWRGGTLRDFELKIDARLAEGTGNSGIQVRSMMMTDATARSGGPRPWGMGGYQIEVSPPNSSAASGTLLEEGQGRRGFLSVIGQVLRRTDNRGSKLIGMLGENITDAIKAPPEWNSFHIIGRGPQITVIVNGRTTQIVIDEDTQLRSLEGLLGLQMHVGRPFRMEFRNIYLKTL